MKRRGVTTFIGSGDMVMEQMPEAGTTLTSAEGGGLGFIWK